MKRCVFDRDVHLYHDLDGYFLFSLFRFSLSGERRSFKVVPRIKSLPNPSLEAVSALAQLKKRTYLVAFVENQIMSASNAHASAMTTLRGIVMRP
jgi:hypothetical protein